MHPTKLDTRRVRSAHRLPLLVVHRMHPTDNYSASSPKLVARNSKPDTCSSIRVGCAPRTDYHYLRCIECTLRSSKSDTCRVCSAHRLPLFVVHRMHPTDNYSASSPKLGARNSKPDTGSSIRVGCAPRTDYHYLRCIECTLRSSKSDTCRVCTDYHYLWCIECTLRITIQLVA
jgi:hypothetical protein